MEGGTRASGPKVPTAGQEGVWPLDPDVTGIEVVSFSFFDTVPLEALQESLGEGSVAVVRIEDVHVLRTESGTLPQLARQVAGGFLHLV